MIVFRVLIHVFNIDCFMGVLNTYVGCNWTNWNTGVWNIGLTAENWFSIWLFWGLQLFWGRTKFKVKTNSELKLKYIIEKMGATADLGAKNGQF